MKTDKAAIIVLTVILLITVVAIGFVTHDTAPEQIHPVGPMTGDEQIHPCGQELQAEELIDEMTYIPAYPGDECAPEDRVLLDTPIRVVDTDGTVYWHWFYENRSMARNR